MSILSKKNKEVFTAPLGKNNPVTVQVLGICSSLADTVQHTAPLDYLFQLLPLPKKSLL